MTYDFPLEPDLIDFDKQPNIFTDGLITKEPRKRIPRMNQYYVEDCIKISVGNFGRHILQRANPDKSEPEKVFVAKNGSLARIQVFYTLGEENLTAYLKIRCEFRGLPINQYIELDCSSAHFGLRPFLSCACGKRCSNLYLHPEKGYGFVCLRCLNLNYELNGINKKTEWGKIAFWGIMMNKMAKYGESVKRPYYNNHETKRLQSYAKRYCKFKNFVEANKVLTNS